jgi:uncharacterized protein YcfL
MAVEWYIRRERDEKKKIQNLVFWYQAKTLQENDTQAILQRIHSLLVAEEKASVSLAKSSLFS